MSKREIACVAHTHTDNIFFKIMNHLEVTATVLCALFAALEIKKQRIFLAGSASETNAILTLSIKQRTAYVASGRDKKRKSNKNKIE